MTDFRKSLYRHYVSAFKRDIVQSEAAADYRQFSYFQYKYLPGLQEVNRAEPVLDLGCGSGTMLGFLRAHGFTNAVGIDISQEQIAIAKQRGLAVMQGDALEFLAEHTDEYAAIIALDFLEHFSKDELMILFDLIRTALKSGGIFLFQTPNGGGLLPGQVIYGDLTHMTIFTKESLTNILTLFSFEILSFRETGPIPVGVKGRVRVVIWGLIRKVANAIRMLETGQGQQIWTENIICFSRKRTD